MYIICDGWKQKERVHWAALGGVFDVAARIHTCNGVSSNRKERREEKGGKRGGRCEEREGEGERRVPCWQRAGCRGKR